MGKLERPQQDNARAGVANFDPSPSFLICALANKIAVIAARNVRKLLDLSLMEWRVLAVLAVEPAASPGRIIEVSGVNKAAVSRAVSAMERRGLVTRAPAPGHGLRTQLHLTAAGHAVHDQGIGARVQAEEQLLAGLTPADRARLSSVLRQLARNLDPA